MATTSTKQGSGGDTSNDPPPPTAATSDVVVTDPGAPAFSTKPGDVPADPRTGAAFTAGGSTDGLKGQSGMDDAGTASVVPGIDPDRIPAEVTPGVTPDADGDRLLAAAQAKAPSLTRAFVTKMGLTDEDLAKIARGEVPPPPTPGPIYSADLHLTPGGWQQTPPGVAPGDVGANAISR